MWSFMYVDVQASEAGGHAYGWSLGQSGWGGVSLWTC